MDAAPYTVRTRHDTLRNFTTHMAFSATHDALPATTPGAPRIAHTLRICARLPSWFGLYHCPPVAVGTLLPHYLPTWDGVSIMWAAIFLSLCLSLWFVPHSCRQYSDILSSSVGMDNVAVLFLPLVLAFFALYSCFWFVPPSFSWVYLHSAGCASCITRCAIFCFKTTILPRTLMVRWFRDNAFPPRPRSPCLQRTTAVPATHTPRFCLLAFCYTCPCTTTPHTRTGYLPHAHATPGYGCCHPFTACRADTRLYMPFRPALCLCRKGVSAAGLTRLPHLH